MLLVEYRISLQFSIYIEIKWMISQQIQVFFLFLHHLKLGLRNQKKKNAYTIIFYVCFSYKIISIFQEVENGNFFCRVIQSYMIYHRNVFFLFSFNIYRLQKSCAYVCWRLLSFRYFSILTVCFFFACNVLIHDFTQGKRRKKSYFYHIYTKDEIYYKSF